MYNRYIPKETSYTRVEKKGPERPISPTGAPRQHAAPRPGSRGAGTNTYRPWPGGLRLPAFLSGKEGEGLGSLLKGVRLDDLDSGDILLILVALYLLIEGDDLELVIALGLVFILGLGDKEDEGEHRGREGER